MKRRHFLASALGSMVTGKVMGAKTVGKKILLRSSWQTVNIGDIAHTPGILALMEKHLPGIEIFLWPSKVDNGVAELLLKRFPKLRILQGPDAIKTGIKECDFLLHGSGPSLVGQNDIIRWKKETGKPYGVYGITLPLQSSTATAPAPDKVISQTIEVLNDAKFVYYRDSFSMELAKKRGCKCPIQEFGPDATFAMDLRDDSKAMAFLQANELESGKFLCCIPRLRFTPYWVIPSKKTPFDEKKHARNEAMKDHDHSPHRQAIIEIVKQTNLKVLICPEDQTQMAVGKELLFDPLPAAVKKRVVWRPDYWMPGEALSVYKRSAGLFGNEMHSPIMCIGNGVPAVVCRWAEQTSKGLMWKDIGLQDWLFDLDKEGEVKKVVPTVLAIALDPASARSKAHKARDFVERRQEATMNVVQKSLN